MTCNINSDPLTSDKYLNTQNSNGKPTLLSFAPSISDTNNRYINDGSKDKSIKQTYLDSLTLKPTLSVPSTNLISIIPKTPTDSTGKIQFDIDMKILQENISKEYNYYNCRYAYCLKKLLTEIGNTPTNTDNINKYLDLTVNFNTNINDLLQIMDQINTYMMTIYTDNENNLKSNILVNGDPSIEKLRTDFKNQRSMLSGENATTKLRKEMVKYTEEKARYTDNLLKMYSVLNIVALGLLVYVYKSAG